jgi:hypothetical protein
LRLIGRAQISLHNGIMSFGKGSKHGAQLVLSAPVPAIIGASDLFVSVSRVSADVPAYFKLSLVESFACTNQGCW